MRRTPLYGLAMLGAATVSLGAFAQSRPGDAPPDDTAPTRERERETPAASAAAPDDGGAPASSSSSSVDAAPPSAPPTPSSSGPTRMPAEPPPAASSDEPASPPSATGFSFGLRGGFSIPIGVANQLTLPSLMSGVVPIQVDVGYFITPNLYVGGYGLYGFVINFGATTDVCTDPDESCNATQLRFGAVVDWHFRPFETYDPWIGAGFGYDIINTSAGSSDSGELDQSGAIHGFELLKLEGGLDIKPQVNYGLGPYVELSTGHYASDSSAISLHAFLTFGIRLRTIL